MKDQNIRVTSVSEIINRNPGSIRVFEKFKIDYCCNGKLNFEEACRRANVNQENIIEQLNQGITDTQPVKIRVKDWPMELLANYILANHHMYVKKVTPEISFLTKKVMAVHGALHPELVDIHTQFEILSAELSQNMYKEEVILFPAVTKLTKLNDHLPPCYREKIDEIGYALLHPIDVMKAEHEYASQCLIKLRELCGNYTLHPKACSSYTLLYKRLQEFEEDLLTHIHLENNILFPKIMALEKEVMANSKLGKTG